MDRVKFVVLDFVIQPHPEGFSVAKGGKVDRRRVRWEELTERVKTKVKGMLVGAAAANQVPPEKISAKCEVEGADDERGYASLASLVIKQPTRHNILRIEDFLRSHVDTDGGDIPENAQPNITVKVKDHTGRFLRFQVTDFTLSGPTKGDWKPFTQWYGALKQLGLLGNAARDRVTKDR